MADDKIFVNGMIFKEPAPQAPDFVKGSIAVKVEEFETFMKTHQKKGWVNIDLLVSRGGKAYAALNTYQKDDSSGDDSWAPVTSTYESNNGGGSFDDDIPF